MAEYQLYCFAQSGNAYRAALMLNLIGADWHLAHFVDVAAVLRRARLALAEEIHPEGLPVGTDEVEHQRGTIGVAGLSEAIELVLGHGHSRALTSWSESRIRRPPWCRMANARSPS